jgi:hypothetical protein
MNIRYVPELTESERQYNRFMSTYWEFIRAFILSSVVVGLIYLAYITR